jgi:hypothetical protein
LARLEETFDTDISTAHGVSDKGELEEEATDNNTERSPPVQRRGGRPRKGWEVTRKEENTEEFIQRVAEGSSAAFQCRECGATFPRRWSILMHVRVHTKVGELSLHWGFYSFF